MKWGHDRGLYAVACDIEVADHEKTPQTGIVVTLWRIRCYLRGFVGL